MGVIISVGLASYGLKKNITLQGCKILDFVLNILLEIFGSQNTLCCYVERIGRQL